MIRVAGEKYGRSAAHNVLDASHMQISADGYRNIVKERDHCDRGSGGSLLRLSDKRS